MKIGNSLRLKKWSKDKEEDKLVSDIELFEKDEFQSN